MLAQATLRMASARIGATLVGIAAHAVVRAVPSTDALALLPRRRGTLCGVVEQAGRMVPVVDLARWVEVGPAAEEHGAAHVLILREGARSIGLKVDAVCGMAEVAAADMMRLHHDDDPEEVFHTIVKARQSEAVLSVLEVGRLIDLATAWHQESPGQVDDTPVPVASSFECPADANPAMLYGLFKVSGIGLGVPVTDLAEVLQSPPLLRPGFGLTSCLWRGRHVPVLPVSSFGAGTESDLPALVAVVQQRDLALGIPVDRVLGMVPFAVPADAPLALDGVAKTCYDDKGHTVQLLDTAALLTRHPEAALSRTAAYARVSTTERNVQPANRSAYIVFEADGLAAMPIVALEEIVFLPPSVVERQSADTLEWKGKAIEMIDLRAKTRSEHDTPCAYAMVVNRDGRHRAYIITKAHLIIPPQTGRLFRLPMGANVCEFINVGEGPDQASYRTVEL